MNVIEFHKLTKYYGDVLGCKDIDFSIKKGEIFGFIGPNGAGKSTTIRTMLGLIYPTSGSVDIFSKDAIKYGPEIRAKIGYLPSEVFYYDKMKVIDLLKYSASFYKKDCTDNIIKYSKEEEGIYLIGARKKEYGSKLLSEEELDNLAEEIGLRRPSWQVKTFQEALEDMKEVKHEGYMLRDIETKDIVLKLKSSYYLGVKFLGRLSPKKTKFMFANKKAFKKTIDEDFYPNLLCWK